MEEKNELLLVQEKVKGMMEMVNTTVVNNDEDLALVSDKIKQVKMLGTYADKQKEKYTAPAKMIIDEAKRIYDPAIKECKAAEVALKGKAVVYMRAKEDARLKAEAKIAADLEAGKIKKDETAVRKLAALPEKQTQSVGEVSTLTMSKRAVPKIVNRDMIPDEYWVIDEVAVRKEALARHKEGLPQLPGVEIVMEDSMSSR